jgi:hypothetical protein
MTRKVRSRELARGAGENRRARNSRVEGCIRSYNCPDLPAIGLKSIDRQVSSPHGR